MKTYQFSITSVCQSKGYFDYTFEKTKFIVNGNNIDEALYKLCETIEKESCYEITKTALKKKEPIYRDTESGCVQVGYIIKAHSEARNDQQNRWVKIVSDLWINILEVNNPFAQAL